MIVEKPSPRPQKKVDNIQSLAFSNFGTKSRYPLFLERLSKARHRPGQSNARDLGMDGIKHRRVLSAT